MSDEKQGQSTGKPNKFEEQKQHAEERKAAEAPRQTEPTKEPTKEPATETINKPDTAAQKN